MKIFLFTVRNADLAWRAQLRGWKAVYDPGAKALHCRHVLPSRRRGLSQFINYHSLKNRYLMRKKNLGCSSTMEMFSLYVDKRFSDLMLRSTF